VNQNRKRIKIDWNDVEADFVGALLAACIIGIVALTGYLTWGLLQ